MSESAILNQGISLISNSPFQSTLPEEFINKPEESNFDRAVKIAKNSNGFSNIYQFLASKNHVKDLYHSEVGAATLKRNDVLSGPLQNELSDDAGSSHLKIKLLTEYALTQLNPSEKLMSLSEIQTLQKTLQESKFTKEQLGFELQSNFKIIESLFSNTTSQNIQSNSIQKIIDSNEALSLKFEEITKDIEQAIETLYHQYILAFSLCYFENFNIEIPSVVQPKEDRETDELLSHIASVAVQRNVILPTPVSTSQDDSKIEWAKSCLDTLLSQNAIVGDSRDVKTKSINNEDEITHLKTALKDLQFAHQYLTRQYEDERNLNSSVMNTHKNKKAALEKQLAENAIALERSNQRSILVEHEKNVLEKTLDEKMKEIYDLQKQVALLKIDNLGYIHTNGDLKSTTSSPDKPSLSPISPVTGLTVTTVENNNENSRSKYYSNPKTPLLQQNINTYRNGSPSSPKFNSSISVLRNEFKKLVNEMHTTYKSELEKEKVERKRLEHLLKLYEERSNDIDL